jgi:hypothetical protein
MMIDCMLNCGRCKCYICGYSHCQRSLCRGSRADKCKAERFDCGRFVFDAEKLRDALMPAKGEENGANEHI